MQFLEAALLSMFIYGKSSQGVVSPIPENTEIRQERSEKDRHVERLRGFFAAKNSPLLGTESVFVEVADQYDLDWKLLPAIAGVESGFETAGNTTDCNPFGYMCAGHPCAFDSLGVAIRRVAKTLGTGRAYQKFRDTGSVSVLAETYNYVTPKDWTRKVEYFMDQIEGL